MNTASPVPKTQIAYLEKTYSEPRWRILTQGDFEKAVILAQIPSEFEFEMGGASIYHAISKGRSVTIKKFCVAESIDLPTRSMLHQEDIYDSETCPIEHQMNLDGRARLQKKFRNQTSEVTQ